MSTTLKEVNLLQVLTQDVSGLIQDLAKRQSHAQLAVELGMSQEQLFHLEKEIDAIKNNRLDEHTLVDERFAEAVWRLIALSHKRGSLDLLSAHGIPAPSYDIDEAFNLPAPPIGFEMDPPVLKLINRPTTIAGHPVDFPLGLPASVLAANSKWIEFYARRGFDILTYKTVRSIPRNAYQWPNWVFLKNPEEIAKAHDNRVATKAIGSPGYWPQNLTTLSMANSFGVPSFAPEWWQEDIRKARSIVVQGHQVLIVSIVGSKTESRAVMADDFAEVASLAKAAGADIIEANFSCPNVPGDPVGEVYQSPEMVAFIAKRIQEAINPTPLFIKIGYLHKPELAAVIAAAAPFINGVVAINTISAPVVNEKDEQTFPDRPTAGVSGWAIKAKAQEVASNLVELKSEIQKEQGRDLSILAVGGVIEPKDCFEYLDSIGVDGVESCTGAFLNPHLGLDIRQDVAALENRPSKLAFELQIVGTLLKDLLTNPRRPTRIRADSRTRRVVVES